MIKPEFLDECLIKYATMRPEEFIQYVYYIGSYDGRMEEIKAFAAAAKRISQVDDLVAAGIRIVETNKPMDEGEYTEMDKQREDVQGDA